MNGDEYLLLTVLAGLSLGLALIAHTHGYNRLAPSLGAVTLVWLAYSLYLAALAFRYRIAPQIASDLAGIGTTARDVWGVLR